MKDNAKIIGELNVVAYEDSMEIKGRIPSKNLVILMSDILKEMPEEFYNNFIMAINSLLPSERSLYLKDVMNDFIDTCIKDVSEQIERENEILRKENELLKGMYDAKLNKERKNG